jgi:hypothetical protein
VKISYVFVVIEYKENTKSSYSHLSLHYYSVEHRLPLKEVEEKDLIPHYLHGGGTTPAAGR